MKKKKFLSILLLGLATLGFGGTLVNYVTKTMDLVPVYIYTTDVLELNAPLQSAYLTTVSIPQTAVTDDMVTSESFERLLDEADNALYFNTRVYQGQYMYQKQVSALENLDPFDNMDLTNMRRVSLPVTYTEGLAGNVKRGDKIDLIYTGTGQKEKDGDYYGSSTTPFNYSKTVMQNVIVESVSTSDGYKFIDHSKVTSFNATSDQASGDIGIITLAVTLEQAEEIKARQKTGTISIVGRFSESESYDTLGYVVGDYSQLFSGAANAETGRTSIE